jgi:hypothetical protein
MVYCKGGLEVNDKIHFGDTLAVNYWLKNAGDTAFEGYIITNMNTNWNDSVVLDTSVKVVINPGDSVEINQKYATATPHFMNGETTVIVIWPTGDGTKSSFPPMRLKELTLKDDQTGVAMENELNRIRIFPNPASSFFHIRDFEKYQGRSIRLFDGSGRIYTLQTSSGRVDITGIPPGVYFLRIEAETGSFTNTRLVILR